LTHTMPQFTPPGFPEIFIVSNVRADGKAIGAVFGGRVWHSDYYYRPKPASGSILYAREVPPDQGDTLFANMIAAYEALPEAMRRRIDGMKCLHSRNNAYSIQYPERPPLTDVEKARSPDVIHPLVRTHPESGKKALFLGTREATDIVGMSQADGKALLEELREFALQDRFVYAHRWKVGDAVLWDNRSLLHCATPFDQKYRRLMYRTTVTGDAPF
jgi:taurine dioxygenase